MIRLILSLTVLLLVSDLKAQITINSGDLPMAGESYTMSLADTLIGIDPSSTGPNFNWDYGFLEEITQMDENWLNPASTNPLYFSLFGISNVASDFSDLDFGGLALSDAFNFYNNSASGFNQTGLAGVISSVPLPIPFDIPDPIFVFPMNYGDVNGGPSGFNITIPLLATLVEERDRSSEVDGWGSLTTPYGTFDVLRHRSDITIKDSLSSPTLGDFVINRITTEYRWLAAGMGAPILQIDVQEVLGLSVVSRIIYQDSVRTEDTTSTGIDVIQFEDLQLFPNPATDQLTVQFDMQDQSDVTLKLISLNGQIADQWSFTHVVGNFSETLNWNNIASGTYILEITAGSARMMHPVVVTE